MSRFVTQLLCAVALVSSATLADSDDTGLYLYRIPSSLAGDTAFSRGSTVVADLYVQRPAYVAEQIERISRLTVAKYTDRYVRVIAEPYDTLIGGPTSEHRSETFVIDYGEAPVAALLHDLFEQYGPEPSITELTDYTYDTIGNKSYRRNFDIASQVAVSKEGDCTEHAVLLTALARAAGRPARVVFGVLLFRQGDSFFSFGHAWTEIHDGEEWHIADATRPEIDAPDAWLRYLPMTELGDEGPGYTLAIMQFAMVQPSRVDRVGAAADTHAEAARTGI